jgi:hypothetical protein
MEETAQEKLRREVRESVERGGFGSNREMLAAINESERRRGLPWNTDESLMDKVRATHKSVSSAV